MAHAHNHTHDHNLQGKNLLFSIVLNVAITAVQVIGGIVSGSLALLSDALHNFSDVLSLLFSYAAHKLSHKKATPAQTFGYKRAEILAAFVNALTLIVVAIFLIFEAIERFADPKPIGSTLVIWLSIVAIAGNGLSVFLLKRDSKKNLNMRSAYLHLLTDMMASVAVLAGGILMEYFHWMWIDSVLTLVIAIYLIAVGYGLLKDSTKMLMLFTPAHLNIEEIAHEVHKISGVAQMYHIHLWHLSDDALHLEAHLDCSENLPIADFSILANSIEDVLHRKFGISHCTLQPGFDRNGPKDFIIQE